MGRWDQSQTRDRIGVMMAQPLANKIFRGPLPPSSESGMSNSQLLLLLCMAPMAMMYFTTALVILLYKTKQPLWPPLGVNALDVTYPISILASTVIASIFANLARHHREYVVSALLGLSAWIGIAWSLSALQSDSHYFRGDAFHSVYFLGLVVHGAMLGVVSVIAVKECFRSRYQLAKKLWIFMSLTGLFLFGVIYV